MRNTDNGFMWTRAEIEAQGMRFTGVTLPDGHQYRFRTVCKDLDVTLDSIHCFRIAEGQWEVYYTKNYKKGYKEVGILEGVL